MNEKLQALLSEYQEKQKEIRIWLKEAHPDNHIERSYFAGQLVQVNRVINKLKSLLA